MKLSELAQVCQGQLEGDGDIEISDVAELGDATKDKICFVTTKKYQLALEDSRCGAVIAPPGMSVPQGKSAIRHQDPDHAFSKVLIALRGEAVLPLPGIAEGAVMGKRFEMGDSSSIGANAALGDGVKLGKNVILYPGVTLGDDVEIGDDTVIYNNASVMARCKVGQRCIIHAGAVIGADGFGFHFVGGKFERAPQRGTVELGHDVEIGANSVVDRARFDVTRIGSGTKVDNLVQIAHNVQIGQNCVIAGLVGIAGSSVIKDFVQIGGGAGVADHVTIGMGAKIAAKTGVMQDVDPGMKMAGLPAFDGRKFMQREAALRRLPDTMKSITAIQAQIEELQEALEAKPDS